MTTAAADQQAVATTAKRPAWRRLLFWALAIIVAAAFADLVGWDIRGWLSDLWDTISEISPAYIAADIALIVVKTTATAFAWYSILRFAYPSATHWRDIFAGYAVSVALNSVLPANIGTLVMLILFSVVVTGAGFAGVLGAYAVEKIFFTLAGAFVYLYLFIMVGGSFDIKFSFVHERPVATAILIGGGILLIIMLCRRFWPHVVAWWDDAKAGGAILSKPGAYFWRVFVPSFVAWLAMLGSNAVLMTAYGIPVTFDTLMRICGGNSLANVTSVTPGGAGVTQAFNVASLKGVASTTDATAFSVAGQLISTAWGIVFALIVMIWAWGWTGGKQLVSASYQDAKKREQEQREKRREKKLAAAAEKA